MAGGRPSLAVMARQLLADLLAFLGAQAALVSAEVGANAARVRGALLLVMLAGGLVLTGLALLLVAGVLALATHVGAPLAALIVGGGAALAGLALGRHGLARLAQAPLAPQASMAAWQRQIDRLNGRDHDRDPARNRPGTDRPNGTGPADTGEGASG